MRTESTKKDIINFESVKPLNPIAPYLGGTSQDHCSYY